MVTLKRSLFALAASAVLLAGCGKTPASAPAIEMPLVSSGSAMAKSTLKSHTKKVFMAVFKGYDTDKDGKLAPADFGLEEKHFNNIFRNIDTDDDRIVTAKEWLTEEKLADKVEYFDSRARVSAMTQGRMGIDNTEYVLEFYLKPFLNKQDRRKFIEQAFKACDKNKDKVLNMSELAFAYAVVEAKSEEKDIERKVNRSKGQTDKDPEN